MTEADKQLYKVASSGMCKRALQLDDTAKASLIGALGGAGIGALSHAITPKDEDENQGERLLRNLLFGAAMGGLAGYGSKKFYDMSKPAPAPVDSWAERHLDPEVSTVLGLTSLGTGVAAAKKGINKVIARAGEGLAAPLVNDGKFVAEVGADVKLDKAVRDAYSAYRESMANPLQRVRSTLHGLTGGKLTGTAVDRALGLSKARAAQTAADTALHDALHAARNRLGGPLVSKTPAAVVTGFKSLWKNPRHIINSARKSRGAGALTRASAVTALAALLVRELGKDRQQ